MLGKTIFILILSIALMPFYVHIKAQQVNDRLLPEELSETETQTILREKNPRPHVEATLKVSDARINTAIKLTDESQFKAALQNVDVYAALVKYAEDYTRKLPDSQVRDRNHCLKKIEQAIFKQSRNFDQVLREMPYNYRDETERAINNVKKIRIRAINDLLGGGGVINSSNE